MLEEELTVLKNKAFVEKDDLDKEKERMEEDLFEKRKAIEEL